MNGTNPTGFQNLGCLEWPDVPARVVIIGIDIIMIGSQKTARPPPDQAKALELKSETVGYLQNLESR
ncbi:MULTISPECIES: hypothetical protein [unclassified Thiocapsa]|uniref:hypothetical protein n=1 Tax=unclassified Thiocapsa TaxID=2641286 RepID=UPI0035B03286